MSKFCDEDSDSSDSSLQEMTCLMDFLDKKKPPHPNPASQETSDRNFGVQDTEHYGLLGAQGQAGFGGARKKTYNLSAQKTVRPNVPVQKIMAPNMSVQNRLAPKVSVPKTEAPDVSVQNTVAPNVPVQKIVSSNVPVQQMVAPIEPVQKTLRRPSVQVQKMVAPNIPVQKTLASKVSVQNRLTPKVAVQTTGTPNLPLQKTEASNFPLLKMEAPNISVQEMEAPDVPVQKPLRGPNIPVQNMVAPNIVQDTAAASNDHLKEKVDSNNVPLKTSPRPVVGIQGGKNKLQEKLAALRKEQCRLLMEREEKLSVNPEVYLSQDEIQLQQKVTQAKMSLDRLKYSKEQLRQHYDRVCKSNNDLATKEQYEAMKKSYFDKVLEVGELTPELGDLEDDVTVAKKRIGDLERELEAYGGGNTRGGMATSMWQQGVPYGSGRMSR